MRLLITGGAGYIGSHVISELINSKIAKPEDIAVLDNLESGHKENVKYGKLFVCDLRDKNKLKEVFNNYNPKVVIHLASYISALESIRHPDKYYENNVLGSMNLLNMCTKYKVGYIIFSSSAAVYGNPIEVPIKEEHPLKPLNPYGWSKVMVEQMIKDYANAYGFKYAILRFFNVVGCDNSLNLKIPKTLEDNVFLRLFRTLLGKQPRFVIYGNDHPTKDGTPVRDFIHVKDIASAHVEVLKYLTNGGESDIFNVGYGKGISIKELVQTTTTLIGKFDYIYGKRREGDPSISIADNTKLMNNTTWQPKYNDLKLMLLSYWKWLSNA